MEGRNNGGSKKRLLRSFCRRLKALSPTKCLAKARDFYVRNMTEIAERFNYGGLAASSTHRLIISQPKPLGTSDHEFIRILSATSYRSDSLLRSADAEDPFPRNLSRSNRVERIDDHEDSPCYFQGSFRTTENEPLLPLRSRR